jgi:perosamine synthetase
MAKPILISISPNTERDDLTLAFKLLFQPWRWLKGEASISLSRALKTFYSREFCFLLNSGRSALRLGLEALQLEKNDQVLCQAFTCVAVPNAIRWAGATPVFVDTVKDSFNLDIEDLKRKISAKTKAIIIQHNFGIPDNIKKIKKICQKCSIYLIEDCAQSLGAEFEHQKIGSFGNLTVLSFGRDKVISSVWGGAVLTNNFRLASLIAEKLEKASYPRYWWIFKQLLHPVLLSLAIPLYFWPHFKFSLGKGLIFFYQRLNLISAPVSRQELQGRKPERYPLLLPNALAVLALKQWFKLNRFNSKRRRLAKFYLKALGLKSSYNPQAIYLRLPLRVAAPQALIRFGQKQDIMLGRWYSQVIAPPAVELTSIGYRPGSCPQAEKISQEVVNLPTLPKMNLKAAQRVINLIKAHANQLS